MYVTKICGQDEIKNAPGGVDGPTQNRAGLMDSTSTIFPEGNSESSMDIHLNDGPAYLVLVQSL